MLSEITSSKLRVFVFFVRFTKDPRSLKITALLLNLFNFLIKISNSKSFTNTVDPNEIMDFAYANYIASYTIHPQPPLNNPYYYQFTKKYEHAPPASHFIRLPSKVKSADFNQSSHKSPHKNRPKHATNSTHRSFTKPNVLVASRSRHSHSKFIEDFKNSFDNIDLPDQQLSPSRRKDHNRSRSRKNTPAPNKSAELVQSKSRKSFRSTESLDIIDTCHNIKNNSTHIHVSISAKKLNNILNGGSDQRPAAYTPSELSKVDTVIMARKVHACPLAGPPATSQTFIGNQEFLQKILADNNKENSKPTGPCKPLLFRKYEPLPKPGNLAKSKRCNFNDDSSTEMETCTKQLHPAKSLAKSRSKLMEEKRVLDHTFVKRVKKVSPSTPLFREPDPDDLMSTLKGHRNKVTGVARRPGLEMYAMVTKEATSQQKVNEFMAKSSKYLLPDEAESLVTNGTLDHVYDKLYENESRLVSSDVAMREAEEASTIIDMAMFRVQSEKAFFNDNYFSSVKEAPRAYKIREQIYPAKKGVIEKGLFGGWCVLGFMCFCLI